MVKFVEAANARKAKKFLDATNFYGGILHISYAPELESIEDTRTKLQRRAEDVAKRVSLLQFYYDFNEYQFFSIIPPSWSLSSWSSFIPKNMKLVPCLILLARTREVMMLTSSTPTENIHKPPNYPSGAAARTTRHLFYYLFRFIFSSINTSADFTGESSQRDWFSLKRVYLKLY